MKTRTSAPYALAALVVLLGCSENVSPGGSESGQGSPGSGGSGGDGGTANEGGGGGSTEAPTGAGAGPCDNPEGDPECQCSSSDIVEQCRCLCGDQLVEVDGNYACINIEGDPCADGAGGEGGAPTYADCEAIGSYKVCGP